jgi:hypothetical protein
MQQIMYFPASKKKAALLLAGSICFVLLGYWGRNESPIVGWACMLFFGLGIPVSLFMAFSNRIYLLLDSQGFEMASPIKTVRIGWQDVAGFDLVSVSGAKMIAIHYREGYEKQRLLRGAARAVSGVEGAIGNSYAASLPEILRALRDWHHRFDGASAA